MEQYWDLENKRIKYKNKIVEERANFFFLNDGCMVYPYETFDSYWKAMADAVMNHGEDIDDIVSLVFREKVDQPIVKQKLLNLIKDLKNK